MSNENKTALLFSGQGSQYAGMGKKLYDESPDLYEEIFNTGSGILGFDLKNTMFEGTAEELARTEISQPVIFTMSLICAKKYISDGGEFSAVAGHSLGEYAAMVNAGMIDIETGYTIIKYRAACMEKAAKKNGGKMAAVLGLKASEVESACNEITEGGDYVSAVNFNSKAQTVIAGSESGVEKASALLKEKGAKRIVPLAVAAAFHSEYMKEAGTQFGELIKDISFTPPKKAFYSNVSGGRLSDISDIHSLLSRHIFSPVMFTDELETMRADGIDNFIECGPGKALTGMVKKTLDDVKASAIDA